MTTFPRSLNGVLVGIVILCGGLASLFELPKVTPYEFLKCSAYQGGTQCYSNLNPIYSIVFVVSMFGAVLLFFGLFGRAFVLGPFLIVGMLSLSWGLLPVIFGYLSLEWCKKQIFTLCVAYHPEFSEPLLLVGVLLIAVNGLPWHSGLGGLRRMRQQILARFFGITFVAVGIILISFGWMMVGTFVGNYDTLAAIYWMQIAVGLPLLAVGISLLAWSLAARKSESKPTFDEKSNPVGI